MERPIGFWRWWGRMALWWMLLFLLQRTLFLVFAWRSIQGVPLPHVLQAHWEALPMDLSAMGYLLALPTLLMAIAWITQRKGWATAARALTVVFLCVAALINVVDIGLFEAWGTKLVHKAISYMRYPEEAAGVVRPLYALGCIGLAVGQVVLFLWLLRKVPFTPPVKVAKGAAWVSSVVAVALCVVSARGGAQDLPIDKSWSYYSRYPALNLAAVNGVWNGVELAVHPAQIERSPYAFMPEAEAEARMHAGARPVGGRPVGILTTPRPNLLLIFLESWTADIIEPLGGDSGVAPAFTALSRQGLLFDNFYSTGFRTEQGLCAMISGFPSQPTTTIIRNYGKFDQLPSVVRALGGEGYTATYWYAGDVTFANTRAYLDAMGFDRVHDEHSFPIKRRTRWGAFDEELFDFHLANARAEQGPFLHVLMTSTSHEPFDAEVDEGFKGGEPERYRNTVHYTDRVLGAFLEKAAQQDWYANTLVVIVADHGHYLPHRRTQFGAARHRIPLLITGGALDPAWRGAVVHTPGCHVDLPVTLLAQLGLSTAPFEWGRDLLDSAAAHRAFWTFEEGFGIADSVQTVVYDAVGDRIIELRDSARTADRDRLLWEGKARLQVLLDRYIALDQ